MQEHPEEFTALMERIRAGSQDAARLLVEQYGHHILRVVRRTLHKKLRSKFDSVDFQQDVWASFFANQPQKTFERPEALAAFLAKMAKNKVLMAHRARCRFRRHNVNRENSLDGSAAFQAENVTAREPSPSQLAVAQEKWEQLLQGQPPRYQRILTLVRQGYTQQQIAQELGVDERTVRRVVRKVAPEALP